MSATSPDRQTDEHGTWTSETLPMSLRRELLKRELAKLGSRKAGATSSHDGLVGQQQQQSQGGGSDHPCADDPSVHGA